MIDFELFFHFFLISLFVQHITLISFILITEMQYTYIYTYFYNPYTYTHIYAYTCSQHSGVKEMSDLHVSWRKNDWWHFPIFLFTEKHVHLKNRLRKRMKVSLLWYGYEKAPFKTIQVHFCLFAAQTILNMLPVL